MKRFTAPLLVLLFAACGGPTADPKPDELVACAVDGAAGFERTCTVERTAGPQTGLTLRSPSGSFRRLTITGDGRGVVAADGAEPAKVTVIGKDMIEVSIGQDRYRLPARVQ